MDLEQPRMPVRGGGRGDKQGGAANGISSRNLEGEGDAGRVHTDAPRFDTAPGQCQLDSLRTKGGLLSRRERENDND